jgi:pimeloyl-[acyl-carrier protein] methyl ester esterase
MLLLEALAETQAQFAGLILVGVPAVFCRREEHPYGQSPAAVRAMRQTLQKDARRVLQDFASRCLAPGEEMFRDVVTDLFRPDMEATDLAAGLDYLLTADLRARLPRLPVQPVIVQGEADQIVPPEQARFLSEHLPGSRLVMLPGAGHVPFITQAARFNEIVKEIVKGGPGR